ncbi:MAG: glycoside hydrolase family 3 protein [Candidatus Eisenbacteria bacterium]|nr:glycoside hydrolase family 3 protein [Candidatus Eisenbacteria bacterium]
MNKIDAQISTLNLEEKIGQLLVVGFTGTEASESLRKFISDGGFSGFILFKRNIETVEGAKKLLKGLKSLYPKDRPPILAVDEEGGRVTQISHLVSAAPAAATIGRTRNARFAFFHARDIAQKLKWLGFNVVFAPVLDVNDEPTNPVIGDRAYGSDVDTVTSLGIAALRGFGDPGIVPTAKHFPGHGSSKIDSHEKLPVITHPAERWYTFEMVPFRSAIEAGVRIMMTGHIACPSLTGSEELPATFSSQILRRILREELRYNGVVITDAMEMAAATDYMAATGAGPEDAILAGCDLLLFAHGREPVHKARKALMRAVKEGRLSEARVDESLQRVLSLRASLI